MPRGRRRPPMFTVRLRRAARLDPITLGELYMARCATCPWHFTGLRSEAHRTSRDHIAKHRREALQESA